MVELWDVYDGERNKTGRTHERGTPMQAGDYHLVVQVWIMNSKGEFLISKQSPSAEGGKWMTTGGCAVVGDDSLSAALRETKEELGITLEPKNGRLFKQGSFKHTNDDGSAFFDVWIFRQEVDISDVVFHQNETCDAMWASRDKIKQMIDEGVFLSEWYPYLDELFCMCEIPGFYSFVKIEPINKGWSSDKKYYIETDNNERLVLRIAKISEYDRKKIEYGAVCKAATLGLYTPQPKGFGVFDNETRVYYLVTWLDGVDAASVMTAMTEIQKYSLGIKAGELLCKLHTIPAPRDIEAWEVRFGRKIEERLTSYRENNVESENGERVIKYLNDNAYLLKNRTQTFNHGDFNTTNIIVSPTGEVGAIDLNAFFMSAGPCALSDYGDPLWEMICISYMETPDPYFYTGLWNGYTSGKPDDDFFKTTAYYFAYDVLTSLCGGADSGFDNGRFDEKAMGWYDNFNRVVPSWYLKDFYVQYIDGVPFKLKEPFDFSFLGKYGKVFKVYDDQDSGNICFGVADGDNKYFVKFAGAPTERSRVSKEEAIERIKSTVPIYRDLEYPLLTKFISAEEIGGGFAMIFEWTDAECMGRQYPQSREKFMQMPLDTRLRVFDEILEFHAHVAKQGYVAIDFYDGCIMYDFNIDRTVLCDVEFYAKIPYNNPIGRMWGSSRFMSPEEYQFGAVIDQITNVYTMGATAFAFFGDERDRCLEKWVLSKELFEVAKKAVSDERGERQQSIEKFIEEWRAAKV